MQKIEVKCSSSDIACHGVRSEISFTRLCAMVTAALPPGGWVEEEEGEEVEEEECGGR